MTYMRRPRYEIAFRNISLTPFKNYLPVIRYMGTGVNFKCVAYLPGRYIIIQRAHNPKHKKKKARADRVRGPKW